MTKRILAVLVVLLLAGTVGLVAGCGGNLPEGRRGQGRQRHHHPEAVRPAGRRFRRLSTPARSPTRATDPAGYKQFQQDVLEYMITYQLASQKAQELKITVTDAEVQKEIDSSSQTSLRRRPGQVRRRPQAAGHHPGPAQASYKESMLLQKVYDEVTKRHHHRPGQPISRPTTTRTRPTTSSPRPARRGTSCSPRSPAGWTAPRRPRPPVPPRPPRHVSTTDSARPAPRRPSSTTSDTSTATASSRPRPLPPPRPRPTGIPLSQTAKQGAGAIWWAAPTGPSKPRRTPTTRAPRRTGGDLGTISKGEMVKEFEDAVFSLKLDEISSRSRPPTATTSSR